MMSSLVVIATMTCSLLALLHASHGLEVDPNGYITFCPCMGRFGNQADQYLGVLAFAKGLNRTLILPPWVEYEPGKHRSTQIPFDLYFRLSGILPYHRAITMEKFMRELAPTVWPPSERTVFCYSHRRGDRENDCNAKDGNPFGPFWDTFNIDFVKSEFYGPLSYDTRHSSTSHKWNKKYPPEEYPVLAFSGAPAAFPILERDVELQKYFKWSALIENEAEKFIRDEIGSSRFLGIHLRNGADWKKACEHATESRQNLFGSWQCLGHKLEHGTLTKEMCFPSKQKILSQIKKEVKRINAQAIFVAADSDYMISDIEKLLKNMMVRVLKHSPAEPHVDLAILAKADHYIGNCVSTFSSFATRERRVNGKTCSFWAFNPAHDEL